MKTKLFLLSFMLLFATTGFSQGDLFIDPTSQEGSDWSGFRMYTIKNGSPYMVDGQPAIHTSVDLVCGEGQVVLDTVGLVRDLNSTYYITPAIIVITLKDANGVVVSTQTIDQYHIIDSSQRNYADPLRANDTICWNGLVDNNLTPNVGTEELPRMSEGYGNGFHGPNEEIPAYLPLTAPLPSGEYEYCVTADFSYFLNESTDPDEIPDFWCAYYSYDEVTGEFTRIPYPAPPVAPEPITTVTITYTSGSDPVVAWEDVADSYEVESYIKKRGEKGTNSINKKLNTYPINTNSFTDTYIKDAPHLIFGEDAKNGWKFYYRIKPNGGEWKRTKDKKF